MDDQKILDDILLLLEANGVKIRREPLDGSGGGLCRIKEETVVFLDTQTPPSRQATVCAVALARLIDLESVYLRPEIRAFIEARMNSPEDI